MLLFTPRLDILPEPHQRLWPELVDMPADMILYGGTAIALQLGHRHSPDFDFFAPDGFDTDALIDQIPFLADAAWWQSNANTLSCLIDRGGIVKVSFFAVPRIGRVEDPLVARDINLRVASLLDLAGMKASIVQSPSEAVDYIDIAALIAHGISLPSALAAAGAIYGPSFNPQAALKALAYFEDGDLPFLPAATKSLLQQAVRDVDLDQLPRLIPVRPGGPNPPAMPQRTLG